MPVLTDLPEAALHPRFELGPGGEVVAVQLEPQAYALLLTKADVTDAALWPAEYRQGAGLLARIRAIEAECIKAHGEWDFDSIAPAIQDEYDVAIAALERLVEPGPTLSLEQCRAERIARGLDV